MWLLKPFRDDVSRRFMVLGGSHVLGAALGFLVTVIAVRALGDAGFSSVAIAVSLQGYAFAFVSFGLDFHAIPNVARNHGQMARYLATTTLAKLSFSVPIMILLLVIAYSGVFDRATSLAIAVVSPSLLFFALFPLWTCIAVERTGIVAAVLLGGQVVQTVFAIVAFALDAPGWGFVLAKVGSDIAMAVVALAYALKLAGPLEFREAARDMRSLLRSATPIGISQIVRSTVISLDIAVLGLFVVASEVGQYAVAFRIYMFITTLGSRYFMIVLPIFSRQISAGAEALRAELHKSLWRSLPAFGLGLAAIGILAEYILGLLFGAEFAAIAPEMRILLAASLVNFMHLTYRQILLAASALKEDLTSYALGALVKVTALVLLSYGYGVFGAALAVLLGDIAILVLQRRAAQKVMAGKQG